MIKVGDIITVYGQGDKQHEVLDLAYLDNTFAYSTSLEGTLMVKLEEFGWIPVEDCVTFDVMEEEQTTQLDSTLSWREGLDPLPDNSKLPEIVTILMAIQYDKEKYYGSSWKGKGEYRGIMANIDRKYDRLDKMTQDEIEGAVATLGLIEDHLRTGRWTEENVAEGKIDAVADLTNYGLLYMTYIKDNFPLVFEIWMRRNVPSYLANKMPFIGNDYQRDTES